MSVLFTSIFSAGSIVWDREFGFLREILVAPVSRASIVIGKCLGGATIATFQGIIFLALAGFAHVPYNPVLLLTLVGELLLLSFTLTAFGVMMAARIKQFQAFMALTQMLVMPLFFLSGALYPLNGLPGWLTVLTRIDPLTYVVGPMRHAVFSHLSMPVAAQHLLAPGVTWGRLAGAAVAVAGDRRGHGPGDDGDRDRPVPQDRVIAERTADPRANEPSRSKKRATPGGYGGKPPGVAFIGAPTGARNAGNGAPAGDQSTGKHVTPNLPHVRQDRIRSESADDG